MPDSLLLRAFVHFASLHSCTKTLHKNLPATWALAIPTSPYLYFLTLRSKESKSFFASSDEISNSTDGMSGSVMK